MAKFTCMEASMSIEPLLNFDKTMARQPTPKLILCNNPGFKNSAYNALKKQRKNSSWIIKEAYLHYHISGRAMRSKIMARKSNKSFIFARGTSLKDYRTSPRFISSLIPYLVIFVFQGRLNIQNHAVVLVVMASTAVVVKLLQIHKYWKWLINLFKGTKFVKDKHEEINKLQKTTSAAPNHKWTLTGEDLFCTLDAYKFENFVFSMCILLAWWVLSGLSSFIRRFHSTNVRK